MGILFGLADLLLLRDKMTKESSNSETGERKRKWITLTVITFQKAWKRDWTFGNRLFCLFTNVDKKLIKVLATVSGSVIKSPLMPLRWIAGLSQLLSLKLTVDLMPDHNFILFRIWLK